MAEAERQITADDWYVKGIYTPKLPKLDLTTDAEYVANLANVNCMVVKVQ